MNGENNFFKSAFSVDNVIFGFDDGDLKVLLIKRGAAPFQGLWGRQAETAGISDAGGPPFRAPASGAPD